MGQPLSRSMAVFSLCSPSAANLYLDLTVYEAAFIVSNSPFTPLSVKDSYYPILQMGQSSLGNLPKVTWHQLMELESFKVLGVSSIMDPPRSTGLSSQLHCNKVLLQL